MTTFWLVRHAVTADTGRKLTGWTPGVHLNEDGKSQAELTARWLSRVPFKQIYASPIERTMETAQAIAAPRGLEVTPLADVGEVRYGRWTNRSLKSLHHTKLWAAVQRFPSGARFPEGESLNEVQSRAVAGMERVRAAHPKHAVCIVSHGDVIKLIVAHYLGVHIDLFQRIVIAPASFSVMAVGPEGPRVLALNTLPFELAEPSPGSRGQGRGSRGEVVKL